MIGFSFAAIIISSNKGIDLLTSTLLKTFILLDNEDIIKMIQDAYNNMKKYIKYSKILTRNTK